VRATAWGRWGGVEVGEGDCYFGGGWGGWGLREGLVGLRVGGGWGWFWMGLGLGLGNERVGVGVCV